MQRNGWSARLAAVVTALALWRSVAAQQPATSSSRTSAATAGQASPSAADARAVSRPKSFDPAAMDTTVNPCDDFYEYACGTWRRNHPIPADQSAWGRFNELAEYNREVLHQILEKASHQDAKRGPITQKVGDFYAACMDEPTINRKASAPLQPMLNRIAAISNRDQLMDTVAYLQSQGVLVLFGFGAQPDLHNASVEIANISQGGLTLPDRDYYLNSDAKSMETRERYLEHMRKMFVLLGDDQSAAQNESQAALDLETKLADAAFERVKMRDPRNRDHKMKVSELNALVPNFAWAGYFQATAARAFAEVNVVPPEFFQKVNVLLDSVSLADWRSYLRWHAAHAAAPLLSSPFFKEEFDFFSRYLSGEQEPKPRWNRCVQLTDMLLGEALGQPYVAETFGPEGKQRMLQMVAALEKALAQDIQELPWMTAETKKQALIKLAAISNKIGYPDHWRDYSTVNILRDDFLGNVQRARAFERRRNLDKIGQPLDKSEWRMTAPTVNAYYSPPENDINFPAGILQPPFFDKTQDHAVNFGGIGMVIGHELTHGFDDQGCKYDAQGNLHNWWTDADRAEFEKRTNCLVDEYSSFVAVDDVHLNGRLTLGENTADNGGVRIALMALRASMLQAAKNVSEKKDGFTPEQRFFLGFAQVWCENRRPEASRVLAKTNPHSPGRYRVNGSLQNNTDFANAFGCKEGQKMVNGNACRIW